MFTVLFFCCIIYIILEIIILFTHAMYIVADYIFNNKINVKDFKEEDNRKLLSCAITNIFFKCIRESTKHVYMQSVETANNLSYTMYYVLDTKLYYIFNTNSRTLYKSNYKEYYEILFTAINSWINCFYRQNRLNNMITNKTLINDDIKLSLKFDMILFYSKIYFSNYSKYNSYKKITDCVINDFNNKIDEIFKEYIKLKNNQ